MDFIGIGWDGVDWIEWLVIVASGMSLRRR